MPPTPRVPSPVRLPLALGLLALAALSARPLSAAPHGGEPRLLKQPDGSRVEVRLFGDELYVRAEDPDGRALIRDAATGYICYATPGADGTAWVSTGIPYGISAGAAGAAGAEQGAFALPPPGADLTDAARAAIRASRARELGLDGPGRTFAGEEEAAAPLAKAGATDSVKKVTGLFLLVDFPDVRATFTPQQLSDLANQPGYARYGNNGSVRDYFLDVSRGKYDYSLVVTQYYRARNNKAYYDRADGYAGGEELVAEALRGLAAKGFDYSTLTLTASGSVLAVNVLFAGDEGRQWGQGLWAHRGSLSTLTFGRAKVNRYMLSEIGDSLSIGVIVHENGHLLFNWPDLYDYDGDSRGTGSFCLMSGQDAVNPQPPNPWFRAGQGWEPLLDLKAVTASPVRLASNGRASYVYRHPSDPKEAYVLESVMRTGRWGRMPGQGLLVWHVDEDGNNSWQDRTASRHYKVAVVQADGKYDLEMDRDGGDAGDFFQAAGKSELGAGTVPSSKWWNGAPSGLEIRQVGPPRDTLTFHLRDFPVTLADPSRRGAGPGLHGGGPVPSTPRSLRTLDGRRRVAAPDGARFRLPPGIYLPEPAGR